MICIRNSVILFSFLLSFPFPFPSPSSFFYVTTLLLLWPINCILSYNHPFRNNDIAQPNKLCHLLLRSVATAVFIGFGGQNVQFPDIYFPVYPTQRTFTPTTHEHLPHSLIGMVVLTCNNSVTMWTACRLCIKGEAECMLKHVKVSRHRRESLSSTTQWCVLFIFQIHATTLYFQKKRIKL